MCHELRLDKTLIVKDDLASEVSTQKESVAWGLEYGHDDACTAHRVRTQQNTSSTGATTNVR
jgi:predicted  nucleic acid-binding Zn ribbon protein